MFKKKVKKRKGFSLVEMLVVIAIIAVLVSITVPIVNAHTVKARAATNAANLRSVEGMLSTLRVERPELFYDAVTKLGSPIDELVKGSDEFMENLFTGLGWDWKKYKEDSALVQLTDYKACHFKANEDGELTISGMLGSEGYTLTDVPAAVAVSAGGTTGMEVKKGTPMTIWVSENGVVATYESGGGAYTRNDFAEVAETGEFNSTASGGTTEGSLECKLGRHTWQDNGDNHKCEYCGKEEKHSWNAGACKCGATCSHDEWNQKFLNQYKCNNCGMTCGDSNLTSDVEHDFEYVDATTHKCKTCGYTTSHDGDTKCDACNATRTKTAVYACKEYKKGTKYFDLSELKNKYYCTCGHIESVHGSDGECSNCKSYVYGSWTAPTN